jgi:putative membrane protein
MKRCTPRAMPTTGAIAILALTGAASPALGAPHARSGERVSALDRQSLQSSIAGDRSEIRGGHLAQRRGQSQAVRSLGARLVTDHTMMLRNSVVLARRFGIAVPSGPTAMQRQQLRTAARFRGRAFDQRYTRLEIAGHQMAIADARREIRNGSNSAIRNDARTGLPILQTHLGLARSAQPAGTRGRGR